jgi:photosystem II stability/assembly factor-like uncharacterized protein
MPSRSNLLRFAVPCILMSASLLAAQSTPSKLPPGWPHFPPTPPGILRPGKPVPPQVAYLPVGGKLLSSSTGWAESGNRLLWTTDDGAHWKDISPPNPYGDSYADVFFVDQTAGWVLFSHLIKSRDDTTPHNQDSDWTFYLAETQDAGATWSTIQLPALLSHPGEGLSGRGWIVFGDRLNGWMELSHGLTWGSLLHSTDGGLHWEWVKNYPGLNGQISAVGTRRLFVEGEAPNHPSELYATMDSGQTFHRISLAAPASVAPARRPRYGIPLFLTSQTGYVTVTFAGDMGVASAAVLYRTSDGGRTWSVGHIFGNLTLGTPSVSSTVVDSTWVVTNEVHEGTLSLIKLPTSPGQTSAPPYHVSDFSRCSLDFWGVSAGWANCGGRLSSTDDGGTTWTVINPKVVTTTGALTGDPVTPAPAAPPPAPASTGPRWQPVPQKQPLPPSIAAATATTSGLPSGLSQQLGFDVITVPTPQQMQTLWTNSPFYDVGIYLEAPNHNTWGGLTRDWVNTVSAYGWGFVPIWFGSQPPCANAPNLTSFSSDPAGANTTGIDEAMNAYSEAQSIGLDGSIIYLDIEQYTPSTACSLAVTAFVEGFDGWLHQQGSALRVGVYASIQDIPDIKSACYDGPGGSVCAPPDDIWLSRYDNRATVWNMDHSNGGEYTGDLPDDWWPTNARAHQYLSQLQTWGGITLNAPYGIDVNVFDSTTVVGNPSLKSLNVDFLPSTVTYESDPTVVTAIADATFEQNPPPAGPVFTQGNLVGYADGGLTPFAEIGGQQQALAGPNLGVSPIYPTGINDEGTMVGYYSPPEDGPMDATTTGSGTQGIIWSSPANYTTYDDSNAASTELLSINDAGWITGAILDASGNPHCILLKPNADGTYPTTPEQFDEPGGNCENAAIDGIGIIGGNYEASGEEDVFYEDVESGTPGLNPVVLGSGPIGEMLIMNGVNNNGFGAGPDCYGCTSGFAASLFTTAWWNSPSGTAIYGLNDDPEIVGGNSSTAPQEGVVYDTAH